MKCSKSIYAFFVFIFFFLNVNAQGPFSLQGSVRIKNYTQKDYRANAQIFGISETKEGVLCFANQRGVLQYDGQNWRTLLLPDKMESFSTLSIEDDILVANTSGLGIFKITDNGLYTFQDLSTNYTDSRNPISGLNRYKNGFVISYLNVVYVLDENFQKIAEYKDQNKSIGAVSVIDDKIYFRGKENALIVFDNGTFKKVFAENLFEDKLITSVLKFNNQIIIVTERNGVYILENDNKLTWVYNNDEFSFKSAHNINNEFLSLGSFVTGLLVLNKNFTPKFLLNPNKGLNDGTILSQFLDRESNLWLGTANGISKVDLLSPVMKYESVFNGATIEDISEFKNNIILATGGGAYNLTSAGEIIKVSGINNDCYGLRKLVFETDTSIFISSLYDVFKYDDKAVSISEGGPYNVAQSPLNPNHLVVLHYDGIQLLEYNEGKFKEIKYIKGFCEGEPFNFSITEDGTIWIGTKPNDGVYKMHMDVFFQNDLTFERFYTGQGLPEGQTYIFNYENEVYVGTDNGLYKKVGQKFEVSNEFGVDFTEGNRGIHRINMDLSGNIWMVLFRDVDNTYEIGFTQKDSEGNHIWHPEFFYSYDEYIVHSVFHQNESITWLGGPGGLMSFDKSLIKTKEVNFESLIRQIKLGDSLVFGGNGNLIQDLVFEYNPKQLLEFNFTANSYFAEEKTVFAFYLEGYDNDWSDWSAKTIKDYSLDEGTYTFHVKAKNILGIESKVTSFRFTVLPPWYRTAWGYLLFVLIFSGVLFIVVRLSIRRIKQQNIKLEQIVEERTQEVVAQKAEAERQRDFAEEQKHLVEEKNLEITDSINYAKRLQNAILTPVKTIQETFKRSFILFLPKDIVAGDFYWTNLAKSNNRSSRSLIAAADCTGHGVPGAMVSVVCSNALDRSVKEFGLIEPAKILDKVTDLVIETFEQSEDEVKDGMDIAICSYETIGDYVEVQYAGANNPLWVIRDTNEMEVNGEIIKPILENESQKLFLFEVKATKQPVGKYAERKPFENNVLKLKEGDIVYTFTDGFADQFGGENGKKYKYLPFKRYMLSIQNLSMEEQEQNIAKEFAQWKGNFEQVDDICIIGIKI